MLITLALASMTRSSACLRHSSSTLARHMSSSAAPDPPLSMLQTYEHMVHEGKLLPNDTQRHAAYALQLLQENVMEAAARAGTSSSTGSQPVVRGAYIYGHVGCGKTLLMDTFAATTAACLSSAPHTQGMQSDLNGQRGDESAGVQSQSTASSLSSNSSSSGITPVVWRSHFHEFMKHIHGRLHALEAQKPKVLSRGWNGRPVYRTLPSALSVDPLREVAAEIARHTSVLAIDEMHVTDQPDAMLLKRMLKLYHRLFMSLPPHVILLFTSNQPPQSLYKKGQGRKFFQPFVEMVVSSLIVLRMESSIDFRRLSMPEEGPTASNTSAAKLQRIAHSAQRGARPFADVRSDAVGEQEEDEGVRGVVCVGDGRAHQQLLQECWQACCSRAVHAGPESLEVGYGRSIWLPRTAFVEAADQGRGSSSSSSSTLSVSSDTSNENASKSSRSSSSRTERLAYFTFEELLGHSGLSSGADGSGGRGGLSATDYMAITKKYDVIFIEGIPSFSLTLRDQARRFVAFVDTAYENKCRLALSLDAGLSSSWQGDVDGLFQPLLRAAYLQGVNPSQGSGRRSVLPPDGKEAASAFEMREATNKGAILKQEEVLMYHRAASRLVEICSS